MQIRSRFAADKRALFAGNSSKLLSMCPDDRLSVECLFPFLLVLFNFFRLVLILMLLSMKRLRFVHEIPQ